MYTAVNRLILHQPCKLRHDNVMHILLIYYPCSRCGQCSSENRWVTLAAAHMTVQYHKTEICTIRMPGLICISISQYHWDTKIQMIAEWIAISCAVTAYGTFFVHSHSLIYLVQVQLRTEVYSGEGYNIASVLYPIPFHVTWNKYVQTKYYTPQVPPNWGSNSWLPDYDSGFHVTETLL